MPPAGMTMRDIGSRCNPAYEMVVPDPVPSLTIVDLEGRASSERELRAQGREDARGQDRAAHPKDPLPGHVILLFYRFSGLPLILPPFEFFHPVSHEAFQC